MLNVHTRAQGLCLPLSQASLRWYAIHCRSNFERQVGIELAGRSLDYFLPCYEEVHQWKDRSKILSMPLFPSYLFARFEDVASARLAVLRARGVVRILGSGRGIEPIPDEQIEAVRRLLSARVRCSECPYLREGMRVRVWRGALRGIEGFLVRLKNQSRIVISVELIAQSVSAEVNSDDVEPLPIGNESSLVHSL